MNRFRTGVGSDENRESFRLHSSHGRWRFSSVPHRTDAVQQAGLKFGHSRDISAERRRA